MQYVTATFTNDSTVMVFNGNKHHVTTTASQFKSLTDLLKKVAHKQQTAQATVYQLTTGWDTDLSLNLHPNFYTKKLFS